MSSNREELQKIYDKKVKFLRDNVPPDDIYDFAEQALTCADFFLYKWNQWVDLDQECQKSKRADTWIKNLVGLRLLEKEGYKKGIEVRQNFIDDLI